MKNIYDNELPQVNDNFNYGKTLKKSNVKCCYTCEHARQLLSGYYFCLKHNIYLTDEVDYVVDNICDKYEKEE